MKKKFLVGLLIPILAFGLVSCTSDYETVTMTASDTEEPEKVSFIADFYDNYGENWLSVTGSTFSISPNKIKEYYYDSDGSWTYHYTMSSIMSVDIDGKSIESCGSTIIFADSRLQKYEIEIPNEVNLSTEDSATVSTPADLSFEDYWTLGWWWKTNDLENQDIGSKIVIVQSQNGDNICMYVGKEVSWDVPKNLPKTTQITIDDKPLYIHRANFAIIDSDILNQVAE